MRPVRRNEGEAARLDGAVGTFALSGFGKAESGAVALAGAGAGAGAGTWAEGTPETEADAKTAAQPALAGGRETVR